MYHIQYTMYNIQCTMYHIQYTMYNVQRTMYHIQYTMCNVQCTMYNVQRTIYNIQCAMYNVQRTTYTHESLRITPICISLTIQNAFSPESRERCHVDCGVVVEMYTFLRVEPVVRGHGYAEEGERGACAYRRRHHQ